MQHVNCLRLCVKFLKDNSFKDTNFKVETLVNTYVKV